MYISGAERKKRKEGRKEGSKEPLTFELETTPADSRLCGFDAVKETLHGIILRNIFANYFFFLI